MVFPCGVPSLLPGVLAFVVILSVLWLSFRFIRVYVMDRSFICLPTYQRLPSFVTFPAMVLKVVSYFDTSCALEAGAVVLLFSYSLIPDRYSRLSSESIEDEISKSSNRKIDYT